MFPKLTSFTLWRQRVYVLALVKVAFLSDIAKIVVSFVDLPGHVTNGS